MYGWYHNTDKTRLNLADLPKGLLFLASRWIVPELGSLLRWGYTKDKDEGDNTWAGQVDWKWWFRNEVSSLQSPGCTHSWEETKEAGPWKKQKKVCSTRWENNGFLAPFPVETRLMWCLCSRPFSSTVQQRYSPQKSLTISSWIKTAIPNLLPRFGESTPYEKATNPCRERPHMLSSHPKNHTFFRPRKSVHSQDTNLQEIRIFISFSTSRARCFFWGWCIIMAWEAPEDFMFYIFNVNWVIFHSSVPPSLLSRRQSKATTRTCSQLFSTLADLRAPSYLG